MDSSESKREVFYLASRLLQYPGPEWHGALEELKTDAEMISDRFISGPILNFIKTTMEMNRLDLEETYVNTFDFKSRTNLYMTYYSLEEQRERGPALIKLKKKYADAGYNLAENELPDYLPVILEFACVAEEDAANEILCDYRSVIREIYEELLRVNNPYNEVFKAVLQFVGDRDGGTSPDSAGAADTAEDTSLGGVVR